MPLRAQVAAGTLDLDQLAVDLAANVGDGGISPACIHDVVEQPANSRGDTVVTLTLIDPNDDDNSTGVMMTTTPEKKRSSWEKCPKQSETV